MLHIKSDPALDPEVRQSRLIEVVSVLHRAARARVLADINPDDIEVAEYSGVVADRVARLVRTRGGGRLVVDAELFAGLDDDSGLIVEGWDDDGDLTPAATNLPASSPPLSDTPEPAKKTPPKKTAQRSQK